MKLQVAVFGALVALLCLHFTTAVDYKRASAKRYPCPKKQCLCLWGVQWSEDKYGCKYCTCKPRISYTPRPKCPRIDCGSDDCPGGYIKDARGCPTCKCKCPRRTCRNKCHYGYKKDRYDCPTCDCHCPTPTCKHKCPWGYKKDNYGCPTCDCHCPAPTCKHKCPWGYKKDNYGCPTCDCHCPTPTCKHKCPWGYKKDNYGCPTCECKCPHHRCARSCPHGYVKDTYGCQTCACVSPPGYSCPLFKCPAGECLKGYQYSTDEYGCHRPLFCTEKICNIYCKYYEYFVYETLTCQCACAANKPYG